MPIRWQFNPQSRVIASVAQGRIAPQEIHAFLDALEPLAAAQRVAAHLHVSADASPDLLRLGELTVVAQRIRGLLATVPAPWFPNAVIAGSAVQYGVTRMVLGLIGSAAPVEAFRDVAAAAAYANVDPALAQRLLDELRPEHSSGAA